jgi:HD domain
MNNELHTKEVVRFCLELLIEEGGDRQIVIPAAILHDVGWSQLPETSSVQMRLKNSDPEKIKIHEEMGVRIAEGILKKVLDYQAEIDEILSIIDGHDTRKHALSLNDKIVKDADKLFRYSEGFQTIWPTWGIRLNRSKNFDVLKRGIKEWFFLPSSKKIASSELSRRLKEYQEQDYHIRMNVDGPKEWHSGLAN